MARTKNRRATSATSKNAEPKRTPVDTVADLISKASTDEDKRAAVIAATKLDTASMTDTLKAYIAEHAHLVHTLAASAEATVGEADQAVKDAQQILKDRQTAKRKAAALLKTRMADEVLFAYQVVEVHHIWSQKELRELWGVSQPWMSNRIFAGRTAAQHGTKSADDISFLVSARKNDSAALTEALAQPGATVKSVREAVTESRTTREAKNGQAETLEVDAHHLISKVVNALNVLTKNAQPVADVGEVTGESMVRRLKVALAAYERKLSPDTVDDEPTAEDLAALEREMSAA